MDPVQEQVNSIKEIAQSMGLRGLSLLWKNKTVFPKSVLQPFQLLYKLGANLIKSLLTKNSKGTEKEQKRSSLNKDSAFSAEKSGIGEKTMGIAVGELQKAKGAKKTMEQIKGKENDALNKMANVQPQVKVARRKVAAAVDIAKTVAEKVNNTQQRDKKQAPSKGIGI